uniref:Transmembrane protein n=1 Tax=Panagrolaimus davidi TaxID=227884 RepID=A0A914P1X4_9BILA
MSRILTPEESRHVFISSMEHRRKIVKGAPSRIPKILIFVVFVLLTAYGFFCYNYRNMDTNYLSVKVADDEL